MGPRFKRGLLPLSRKSLIFRLDFSASRAPRVQSPHSNPRSTAYRSPNAGFVFEINTLDHASGISVEGASNCHSPTTPARLVLMYC